MGDALDLLTMVAAVAQHARAEGWEVNVAIETGGRSESLTFSAGRTLKRRGEVNKPAMACMIPLGDACTGCGAGGGEPCRDGATRPDAEADHG